MLYVFRNATSPKLRPSSPRGSRASTVDVAFVDENIGIGTDVVPPSSNDTLIKATNVAAATDAMTRNTTR
jgi:hypothetical protein